MADTKTIVAKNVTIAVPCPKKSVLKKDEKGKEIAGEYHLVELQHVKAGTPVTLAADEADALIARGFAIEVKPEADTADGDDGSDAGKDAKDGKGSKPAK